jgi:hypothetical protein
MVSAVAQKEQWLPNSCCHATTSSSIQGMESLPLTPPFVSTAPDLSTLTSGPSHETSKYALMAMLYVEGVKNRLLAGARMAGWENRRAEKAVARGRWWGRAMVAGGGVMQVQVYAKGNRCCQTLASPVTRMKLLCCFWRRSDAISHPCSVFLRSCSTCT